VKGSTAVNFSRHDVLAEVRAELRRLASQRVRDSIDRFFTPDQPVVSYGVSSPDVKRIAQSVYRQVKPWPAAERDGFCTALWESGKNEEGALVCYVYRRFARQCGAREFKVFTRWLDRYVDNWGHTDGLALWLLGASIANEPGLIAGLDAWTRSKNRWKRHASAVALVPSARHGLRTREILRIAQSLVPDSDDMVRKGVGWLLKETYPKKPREVMRFLEPWRGKAPRLVLRYAAEKMSPADRAHLLAIP
jgi:3-methyladenine DNA glycosylase AlkD